MANVTKTTAAPFIPQEWASRALGKLAGNLQIASVANRNWQEEFKGLGDTCNVPVRGAITVADKVAGTPVTPQAPADATIQVVLNRHKVASFLVEDIVRAEANQEVGDGYIQDATIAMAEAIETDGLTVAYTGFTTNSAVGVAGVDATEALVRTIRKTLVDGKVPPTMPKFCFWATKDAAALLGLARFTESDKLGDNGTVLREGSLGRWFGLNHIESQYVVVTGGGPYDTHCVAFGPDALTLAMRPLLEPRGPGAKAATVNYAGLGMRFVLSYSPLDIGDIMTLDCLWGWSVVRNIFGVHVHT
jgi:hypothetical protein